MYIYNFNKVNYLLINVKKKDKKITIILQARVGSSRFPKKVLKSIEKTPMIQHVINRLKKTKAEQIILATTTKKEDKILQEFASKNNILSFAGDENDVLDRYMKSAILYDADPIIRITGDCPLIDSNLIDSMLDFFISKKCDYVSNTINRTFPDGEDIEIFSFNALKQAHKKANLTSEREHVTPYITKNSKIFKLENFENNQDFSKLRWSVDRKEDLMLIRRIYRSFRPKKLFSMNDVLKLLKEKPTLSKINASIDQNEGYSNSLKYDKIISKYLF